jgi:outer membrane biogenesis lipoprotein LolB
MQSTDATCGQRAKLWPASPVDGIANMWKSATVVAAFFFLAACADDQERLKEAAQALAQASAQVEQQDDARCQNYGKPGSAAYLECRTSLENDRASMRK